MQVAPYNSQLSFNSSSYRRCIMQVVLIIVISHLIRLVSAVYYAVVPYNSQFSFNSSSYRRCIMQVAPYNSQLSFNSFSYRGLYYAGCWL